MTVTDDGGEGRSRDQRTRTSPIFARYSLPFGRRVKPLRVSRNDCRLSLRDLNRGCPILRPLRRPLSESNQFEYARCASRTDCTSATEATSDSHARPCRVFAAVMTRRCTSVGLIFSPASWASWRQRMASLNTTRAQPNVRASIAR